MSYPARAEGLVNMVVPMVTGVLGIIPKGFVKRLEFEIGGRAMTIQTTVVEVSQNTEKSPGHLRGIAVTQTLVKDHRLMLVWFVGFYGISTFVGYLTPNPFLCKSVLFRAIQFSISTQFNCQKHFYFKVFKQLYVTIQLSVNTVLMSMNSFISNNSIKHKHAV